MNELENLTKRISVLEGDLKKINEKHLLSNIELRKTGINNGSRGVKGAFILIAFIFILSGLFDYLELDVVAFSPINLIYMGLVLSIGLVAYFGFIFKFTIGAEVSKDKLKLTTHKQEDT